VTAGFFELVGAHLIEGRFFTETDDPKAVRVAIVDELFAKRLWPGSSALGKRFLGNPTMAERPAVPLMVVGVIRHLRHRQPTADVREQIYLPVAQATRNPMGFVVRTTLDPGALGSAIRKAVSEMNPPLPVYDVRPFADYMDDARAARRFTMILAAAFAGIALLLAAMGVYGLTAYGITMRRREFGVRLALGASRREILWLVARESGRLTLIGLSLGLILGAVLSGGLLRSQLYGVTVADPYSYLIAVTTLGTAVLCATWLSARGVTRVSPLESLRAD
jgi:hypothetical protein